ncbi:MAG: hypothetical protein IT293_16295 [Deltaproteobacteria bacterium]|nr:hypothetical protein [Deltaproteobacteria bacterium]
MPRGAPAVKLAITVDPDVHARAARAARQDKVSLSAWMTEAARRALRIRDGLGAVAEWERQHGPLTEEELVSARRRLLGTPPRRPTRRRRSR